VPATATLAWTTPTGTSAANPLVLDGITNAAGTYSVVASATGYCDSEPASEAVKFYITPGSIKPVSPEYLKVDGAPDYSKIDASAASLKEADAEITVYWSAPQGRHQRTSPPHRRHRLPAIVRPARIRIQI
jgi:hypothetical protein